MFVVRATKPLVFIMNQLARCNYIIKFVVLRCISVQYVGMNYLKLISLYCQTWEKQISAHTDMLRV